MPGEGRVRTREGVAGVVLGLDLVGRMVCASREVSSYPLLALLIRHNKAPSAEPQSSPSLQLPLGPFHSDNANPPATLAVLRPVPSFPALLVKVPQERQLQERALTLAIVLDERHAFAAGRGAGATLLVLKTTIPRA